MGILLLKVEKNGVIMLCNGKSCFNLDSIQEVTLIISLPQEKNCRRLHNRMEENANRGRVKRHRTENSTKTEREIQIQGTEIIILVNGLYFVELLKKACIYVNSFKIQVICY